MTNANIILQGRQPDMVNVLARANNAAGQFRDMQHTQQYRNALAQHGAGALRGDQGAMDALAAFDPAAMQGMQAQRQNMGYAANREARASEAHEMAVAEYVRGLSAQEAAAEAAKMDAALMRAAQLVQTGNIDGANRVLREADPDAPLMQSAQDFYGIAMASEKVMKALKDHAELAAGPKPNFQTVGDGQFVDMNNPQAGAQPIPGYQAKPSVPLVDMSGASFGPQPDTRPLTDKPDKGYQRAYDPQRGTWVDTVIPGSQAEREARADALQRAQGAAKGNERERQEGLKLGTTLTSINLNIAALENEDRILPLTGVGGELRQTGIGRLLTGDDAVDLQNRTNQITDMAALDEISRMRQNSPTGGAVGALTDGERVAIGNAVTALNTATSEAEYLRAAKAYRKLALDLAYGENMWTLNNDGTVTPRVPRVQGVPEGIDPSLWENMTAEERALWN